LNKEKTEKDIKLKSNLVKNKVNDHDFSTDDFKEDDIILNYMNVSRQITQEEIDNNPTITMIEEGNENLLSNTKIKINAAGLIGGRNLKDGVSIFGNNVTIANSEFKPDFILNNNDKQNYPYIFAIYFNRELKKYFIRAFNGKSSDNKVLFIKLTEGYSLSLKQKEIICAGNIIFQVTPLQDKNLEIINLSKKEQISFPKMVFDPTVTSEVTIGRDKKCDFSFPKDKSFSRNQTTFYYDNEKSEWVILDGKKNKSSTNGTWVFGTHSFEIRDQLVVEILNSKIRFCFSK
jgi:hypothetical protein